MCIRDSHDPLRAGRQGHVPADQGVDAAGAGAVSYTHLAVVLIELHRKICMSTARESEIS